MTTIPQRFVDAGFTEKEYLQSLEYVKAGGYYEWKLQQRFDKISPSIIRIIQFCYQAQIRNPNEIKKEVLNILQLPKCRRKDDTRIIDHLIPLYVDNAYLFVDVLGLPPPDPFYKPKTNWEEC